MKLSHEGVREILSILDSSSFDSIEIQIGDMKLAARKSGPLPRNGAPATPAAAGIASSQRIKTSAADEGLIAADEGLIEVNAPILGAFYSAPEPGAAPFVKEGDLINTNTTIGIIEVMKVFNNIKADKGGIVARCLIQDGAFVEFGQPILLLHPEA
jgi:acetyl-CoA carboxylase biotin carboxyl carrier protein